MNGVASKSGSFGLLAGIVFVYVVFAGAATVAFALLVALAT